MDRNIRRFAHMYSFHAHMHATSPNARTIRNNGVAALWQEHHVIIFICPMFVVLLLSARITVRCVCSVHRALSGHAITRPFNILPSALTGHVL